MNVQELAVHIEKLFGKITSQSNHIADKIREQPYEQIEQYLLLLVADRPQLKSGVDNFLIKHQGMGKSTLDILCADGYNLQELYDELVILFSDC